MAVVERVKMLACDFCGKDQSQLAHLIAGPQNVCICDECIAQCVEIIANRPADSDLGPEPIKA